MYLFLSLPNSFNNIIDNLTTKDVLEFADFNRRLLDLNAIKPLDTPSSSKAYFGNERFNKITRKNLRSYSRLFPKFSEATKKPSSSYDPHPQPDKQFGELASTTDAIQKAAGRNHYCFLDLENGFWHIRLTHEDREEAAFVPPFGLFEWTVMPFGLCNAPATFQAFMEKVLTPFRHFVSGLLDDVYVFADSIQKLDSHLHQIFPRLVEYGLILNAFKCSFVSEGIFLGFRISKEGIV
ncbi:hypothetical protein K3495_g10516 [Podosphaera aphanis]|nr:hypothetical protein K3495_g10516 [Podosphaera aphanis]